jgi:Serine carboxypeptidase
MQTWVQDFQEYQNIENKKINLWANSYRGFYGPASLAFFERQNWKLTAGQLDRNQYCHLYVDTLGIANGCIDPEFSAFSYPQFRYKNTYGLKVVSKKVFDGRTRGATEHNGCVDLVKKCKATTAAGDPQKLGGNLKVNKVCVAAKALCLGKVVNTSLESSNVSLSLRFLKPSVFI